MTNAIDTNQRSRSSSSASWHPWRISLSQDQHQTTLLTAGQGRSVERRHSDPYIDHIALRDHRQL